MATTTGRSRLSHAAVLALEDGATFRGRSIGALGSDSGRGGLQYRDDRVSGDPDGPLLLPPDRHAHLPPHRQHGRQPLRMKSPTAIQAAGLIIRDLPLIGLQFPLRAEP